MIRNVTAVSIFDELIPVLPIEPPEKEKGFYLPNPMYTGRFKTIDISTKEEEIQHFYNTITPPFLQKLVHVFGRGFEWWSAE